MKWCKNCDNDSVKLIGFQDGYLIWYCPDCNKVFKESVNVEEI